VTLEGLDNAFTKEGGVLLSPQLRDQILQQMASLPPDQQERVLAFAKSLSPASGGLSGRELLRFRGRIDKSDLQMMAQAIEEGCERIDRSEW
jgi:hypothetical protein